MKIHELRLKNFRKFEDSVFRFNADTGVTVLIGDNATGKTAILDALSIMMGSYLLGFKAGANRPIHKNEIRLKQVKSGEINTLEPQWLEGISVECTGSLSEITGGPSGLITWARQKTSEKAATTRKDAIVVSSVGSTARAKVEQGEDVLLPVLSYYAVQRFRYDRFKNFPPPKMEADSRVNGYRNSLAPDTTHQIFLQWFSRLELAAIQKRKEYGVLESVRLAVQQCIPQCHHFYFDIELQELMIEFEDGNFFSFSTLSEGYRNTLAMVADLAHRAARLNPQLGKDATAKTPGIVLIDEVDLHLHPKWQRRVIEDLRKTFPYIQFIVSTHSPFIIQSLKPGEVIDLNSPLATEEESETASPAPPKPFSDRSIEDIVEDVMGVEVPARSERWQAMNEAAKKYYNLLQQANGASEKEKEKLKQELDELSAPFSGNVAYHAFLEMERQAAGLGKSGKADKE